MKYLRYLLILMMPSLAQAQTLFEPVDGSKAMVLLSSLFGGLEVFGAGAGDPFESIIYVFNGAVLIIAGLMVSHSILLSIIGTAHDGEMLGKKLNSAWVPIRLALGTSLALPVFGGYCTMQKIVAILIVNSIGLADQAWVNYVSKDNLKSNISIGLIRVDTKDLGYNILKSSVCLAALNKVVSENADNDVMGLNRSSFGMSVDSTLPDKIVYEFGDVNEANLFKKRTCGHVEFSKHEKAVVYPVQAGIFTTATAGAESQARMDRIVAEQKVQLDAMISSMQAQAELLVNGGKLAPQTIDAIINKYELAIRDKTASEILDINVFKQVSENSKIDGFVASASFFNKVNFLVDLAQRTMAKVPNSVGPNDRFVNKTYLDQFHLHYAPLIEVLSKTQKGRQYGISYEAGGSNNQADCGGLMECLAGNVDLNMIIKSNFTADKDSFVLKQGEHPVMAIKRMGNAFLMMAGAGFTALMGLFVVSMFTPGLAAAAASIFVTFIPMLLVTGFICSWLIPSLPMLIIISGLISWLVLCIEAILISPMIAVMMLSNNGDDLMGGASQGSKLILSLFLKPVLMVFGVVASIALLQIIGDFIQSIFQDAFLSMNEDGNTLILICSSVFGSLIYGYFVFSIIKRIFNLIHELPDGLMKWTTNSDIQLGSTAGQVTGGGNNIGIAGAAIMNKVGAGAGALGNAVKGVGGQGGAGGGKKPNASPGAEGGATEGGGSPAEGASYGSMLKKGGGFDKFEGKVSNYGKAPFMDNKDNKESFFVELEGADGEKQKVWGVGLEKKAGSDFGIGDSISMEKGQKENVTTTDKDGKAISTFRREWKINNLTDHSDT